MFTLRQASVKMAVLLHKQARVPFVLDLAVHLNKYLLCTRKSTNRICQYLIKKENTSFIYLSTFEVPYVRTIWSLKFLSFYLGPQKSVTFMYKNQHTQRKF